MTTLNAQMLLEGVTPGPWDAHEGCVWGAGNPELSGTYRFGTPILRPDTLYRRWGRDVDHEEREANLRLAASAPRLARRVIDLEEERTEAREAFLDMLADANDWHEEPDGDETGNHTTYHLITHWRQLERLCLALGIKEPGYMETWMDALDRAVAETPAALNGEQTA